MRLEIEGLRALKTIQDVGGVTKAADALALSQSAVSHKIRRMEEALDCQLLARKPGGVLLTDAGRRLLPYADRIIALHDEALSGLKKPALRGEVRIGMTEDLIQAGLTRTIGRMAQVFPDVHVMSTVNQSLTLQRKLDDGLIDLAVLQVFDADLRPGDRFLAPNAAVWILGKDQDLPTTATLPFVSYDQHCFFRQWAVSELAAFGKSLRITLECPSTIGVMDAVAAGMGLSMISKHHLKSDVRQGSEVGARLQVLTDVLPSPPSLSFIIRSGAKAPSQPARYIMDEIEKDFRAAA